MSFSSWSLPIGVLCLRSIANTYAVYHFNKQAFNLPPWSHRLDHGLLIYVSCCLGGYLDEIWTIKTWTIKVLQLGLGPGFRVKDRVMVSFRVRVRFWDDSGIGPPFSCFYLAQIINIPYVQLYPEVTSCKVQPFSHKMQLCAT